MILGFVLPSHSGIFLMPSALVAFLPVSAFARAHVFGESWAFKPFVPQLRNLENIGGVHLPRQLCYLQVNDVGREGEDL